jgi:hypothetical protein
MADARFANDIASLRDDHRVVTRGLLTTFCAYGTIGAWMSCGVLTNIASRPTTIPSPRRGKMSFVTGDAPPAVPRPVGAECC